MTRLITAALLIPIGAFLVFSNLLNGLPIHLAVLLVSIVCAYEISILIEKNGYKMYIWLLSVFITLSLISYYLYGLRVYDIGYFFIFQFALLTFFTVTIVGIESIQGSFDRAIENIALSVYTYVLLGVFAPMIALLKMMDMSGWLLAILLTIPWLTDGGGLLFGKLFGKHKIRFLSSPNKTVEGYIGAVLTGFIVMTVNYFIQKTFALSTNFSILQMVILTVFIIIASIIGDLGESTFKRWAHVKDSGDILPGHGGLFDRFDSLFFSAPIYYALLKLMGF